MRIRELLQKYIDYRLWIILEGARLSERESKEAKVALNEFAALFDNLTSQPTEQSFHLPRKNECGLISSQEQILWLLARLFCKLRGSEHIVLAKNAGFVSLLSGLDAPDNVTKELRNLYDVLSNTLALEGNDSTLTQEAAQFLECKMLEGNLDAVVGLTGCLLSPYLSHLSSLDAELLKISQNAFTILLQDHSSEQTNILLHLLALSSENIATELQRLIKEGKIEEKKVYLSLLARKENPPSSIQDVCYLECPDLSEVLDSDENVGFRASFLRQNVTRKHWILDTLESIVKSSSQNDHTNNLKCELGPILLFYLWSERYCDATAVITIDKFFKEPVFQRLGYLLSRRETVITWARAQESHNSEALLNAMYSLLQKYSVLKVLHQSGALLYTNNLEEVQTLLEKCNENSGDNWENTIFQGFCILQRAMNLFISSCKPNGDSQHQPRDFKQYQESVLNIKEELNKLQSQLKKLFSLNFRLEILENIFSLLFVRYEHLKAEEAPSDSGGEDDDSLKSLATVTEASLSPDLSAPQSQDKPDFSVQTKIQEEKRLKPPFQQIQRSGFLAGPLIIRDTLTFMKECLVDCSSALYKQSDGDQGVDQMLQKRISNLNQCVTEAWWRLQLVTDTTDVVDYEKRSKGFIPQPQRGYSSSASSSESDTDLKETSRTRKNSRKTSRSDNTDKSSGSGSNTAGGVSASSGCRGKRVGRRKSRALNILPIETDSIVNVLLANPQSLALLCLARSDYSKAQQVVQTFQLSNTDIANEANFLELFHSLSAEVSKTPDFCLSGNKFRDFATEMSPTNSKMIVSSSLEMVRKAASIGISAVSVTSLVEKILALAPPVHSMEKLVLENHQANMLLGGINEKVLVSVDAAFTLGLSSSASCSLMDVVSQHAKFATTKPGFKGRSFAYFVTTFIELYRFLHSKDKSESAAVTLASWDVPMSLPILNDHLDIKSQFTTALHDYLTSTSSVRVKVGAVRQMVNGLATCCNHYEFKGVRDVGSENLIYLQHLFWYVQTLSFVITRCCPDGSKQLLDPFELLKVGWESLLSRLVFEFEAPLNRVERVSNRLNLDLLQAIVSTCCPSFQQYEADNEILYPLKPSALAWAKISLNAVTSQQDDECSPTVLAATILTDLLVALKQNDSVLITPSDLPVFANRPDIVLILTTTTRLSSIDLDSLDEDQEKTAFLCNVCNLLILHALITLGHQSGLTSSSWSERRSAYNCIGYHIGQMGFVSLSGLMRQLVGPDMGNNLEIQSTGNLTWDLGNKQALFAVSLGTLQSPLVKVYETEIIGDQLKAAMLSYVMHNVRVEGSMPEGCFSLIITPLILQYLGLSSPSSLDPASEASDDSLPTIPQQYMPVTSMARDCAANMPAILEFLEANVHGQLQLQLADWIEAWNESTGDSIELIIIVEDGSKKLGILLQSSMEVFSPDLLQSSIVSEQSTLACEWESCNLSPRVLQYLSKRCWIVALLAERLRRGTQEYQFWPHTESLDRYIGEKFAQLNAFGDGNLILGALKPSHVLSSEIWAILDKFALDQNDDECIQMMMSLPENMILDNVRLQTFRDLLLFSAASQSRRHGIEAPHRLALSLGTAELRAQCILRSIQYWSGDHSIEALKTILGDPKITSETRKDTLNSLKQVVVYQQVHKVLCYYQPMKSSRSDGWHQILCMSDSDPGQVLQALIEAKQFRLCLQWAELHGVPSKANHLIDCKFVAPLLDSADVSNFSAAEKLLTSVPTERAVSICRRLLACLTSMASLQFVIEFALRTCQSWLEQNINVWASFQLWSVGLSILRLLPEHEQKRDRNLASKPHLLLEQLLMNTKLGILSEALIILRSSDLKAVPSDNLSHLNSVDAMLKSYANKALDFRVAQRIIPEMTAPDPGDLLQSLSTGSTGSGPAPFSMPAVAPIKEKWVPNDEVTDCMCCHLVPFSMFNRRHHCRRCGRVVCGTCSNHRAKVDGYGELQVRVCDDCFIQMRHQTHWEVSKHDEPSIHSSQQTCIIEWTLSGIEVQDETAREEFSFEHAPSVALCLSILGLHSDHAAAQPRFLLEAAEKMLQMLAPPTPGFVNPELDYTLVIRMARSLVVAAKVRYAKAGLNLGVGHCDRLLGQVDLLSLLVKSGCANLLPVEPLPLSGHALRHLRDRLLSAEQWSLALEVSTKAGLDRTGVWAAWGKACLKAGKWQEAREHLMHCLQPTISSTQDSAPAPLLSEITRILEESSYVADDAVMKQSERINSPALSVLHSLNSLTAISQGKLSVSDKSAKKPSFYAECQYYLKNYGSTASTVAFFLSHADLVSALKLTRDKLVEPEVFAEALYKPCLVLGLVGQLFKEMKNMDPSLEMWKKTIMHVGRLLEKQGLWNSLYQLQLFAQDYVRAAMTCVRFYKAGARCYSDLNPEQLTKARSHIEHELTTHWAAKGLKRASSVSSSQSAESPEVLDEADFQIPLKMPARTLDHNVNTISRQLEAAKFLQQCELVDRTTVVTVTAALIKLLVLPGPFNLVPTLFGDNNERILVAALILLCGKNMEEGFGTTFRIIQYFRLKAEKVYSLVAQYLVETRKTWQIPQLVNCILSSGAVDAANCSDQLVIQCIQKLTELADGLVLAEPLLRLISNTEAKIQSHIICGYLKSAYLLAVRSGRVTDVEMILSEAEKQNQPAMIRICQQWLVQYEKSNKI